MKKYYYYVYTCRSIQTAQQKTVNGVHYGDVADLILEVHHAGKNDKYYNSFVLTFYQEITKEQYNELDGVIG